MGLKRHVRCPQCGGESIWGTENPYRPFCCERCKPIDLGAWAAETYRVPVQEDSSGLADFPEDAPVRGDASGR